MSVISERYYLTIRQKISEIRGVALSGYVVEPGYTQTQNRISLIFALEVVLHLHREKHSTAWDNLQGKKALEHLLIQKYSWTLSDVRALDLSDIFLCLHEELLPENLPPEALQLIQMYSVGRGKAQFPDYLVEEWDPNLYLEIKPERPW